MRQRTGAPAQDIAGHRPFPEWIDADPPALPQPELRRAATARKRSHLKYAQTAHHIRQAAWLLGCLRRARHLARARRHASQDGTPGPRWHGTEGRLGTIPKEPSRRKPNVSTETGTYARRKDCPAQVAGIGRG